MSGASEPAARREDKLAIDTPPRRWLRFVPLAVGAAALLLGLGTGLARLGLPLPGGVLELSELHGGLMICGFLGTLISLERAVALGRWWAYGAPALSALGALALIANVPWFAAPAFLLAGLLLTLDSMAIMARHAALFTVALTVAAGCWGVGTLEWLRTQATADATGWWLAFLVLTIAAERLELSRLLAPPRLSQTTFALATSLLLIGAARGELAGEAAPFTGVGFIALTLWLLKHDIALRTIRQFGQARFSATCMLAGYAWLGVAGVLLVVVPPGAKVFSYDAAIHAITIGFVLSMVFGHAAIILPAVTGLRVKYSAVAYAPLGLLHLSVLVRVAADLLEWMESRAISGIVTVLALASYAGILIWISRMRASPRTP